MHETLQELDKQSPKRVNNSEEYTPFPKMKELFSKNLFKRIDISIDQDLNVAEDTHEIRQRLLTTVKQQVKRLMEESVTRRFIHEESSSTIALCTAVDDCLQFGLKKRSVALFRGNLSLALLSKISKSCAPAAEVLTLVQEYAQRSSNDNSWSLNGSSAADGVSGVAAAIIASLSLAQSPGTLEELGQELVANGRGPPPTAICWSWIRIALTTRKLASIVRYLVEYASKYYEKHSVLADVCDGPLLADLLEGPCSLEYTSLKTYDSSWTDPPANELMQRHNIFAAHADESNFMLASQPSLSVTTQGLTGSSEPDLGYHTGSGPELMKCQSTEPGEERRRFDWPGVSAHALSWSGSRLAQSTKPSLLTGDLHDRSCTRRPRSPLDELRCPQNSPKGDRRSSIPQRTGEGQLPSPLSAMYAAKDHVEALHQNRKSELLYGKNNVLVQSENNFIPGYLSLHKTESTNTDLDRHSVSIKWTPNPVAASADGHQSPTYNKVLWDLALDVSMDWVVYIHCHLPKPDSQGGSVVLVGRDGVNITPLYFPAGIGLSAFLNCLEQGLKPFVTMNPSPGEQAEQMPHALYRIDHSVEPVTANTPLLRPIFPVSDPAEDAESASAGGKAAKPIDSGDRLHSACKSMRLRILSRAFYGWLKHCRSNKTVRMELADVVFPDAAVFVDHPVSAAEGLTHDLLDERELWRRIYFGGCEQSLRKIVWPFILGCHAWEDSQEQCDRADEETRAAYEDLVTDWLAVEAIVRERERALREQQRRLIAKSKPPRYNNSNFSTDSGQATLEEADTKPSLNETIADFFASIKSKVSSSALRDSVKNERGESEHSIAPSTTTTGCDSVNDDLEDTDFYISSSTEGDGEEEPGCSMNRPTTTGFCYPPEVLSAFAINLQRIDKDVARCDRHYDYYSCSQRHQATGEQNLRKLRSIMCTWVWQHLDTGYVQGMCDLLAPILVVVEAEHLAFACFTRMMCFMLSNFPQVNSSTIGVVSRELLRMNPACTAGSSTPRRLTIGRETDGPAPDPEPLATPTTTVMVNRMDLHLRKLRSLMQIVDSTLYRHIEESDDCAHFYFCYRWFLLDFKREMKYDDVFRVWETIWAAKHLVTPNFSLFFAAALIEYYRDVIVCYEMDFTDIIRFFNERAEHHDTMKILRLARNLVFKVQELVSGCTTGS